MRIAVTGPTSFLGAAFARVARDAGHEVIAVTRRRTAAVEAVATAVAERDIRRIAAADLAGADSVVHFATGSDGDSARIVAVAVDGTMALLAAARDAGVRRLVHISSMSVYPGPVRRDPAVPGGLALEDHPDRRGAYAQSKTMAETALHRALADDPPGLMEVDVLRPGLVFGRDMKDPLAGTATSLPLGVMIALGRPGQAVPFIDLDDLVRGLLALLAGEPQPGAVRVFDVLSGDPPDRRTLIGTYRRLSGQPCRTVWVPRWLARPSAWLVDRLCELRRQPRHIAYKIDRAFAFDAGDLPRDAFWQAAGIGPRAALPGSLAAALSVDRMPGPSAALSDHYKARAQALLGCVAARAPDTAKVPVVLVGAGRVVEEMHLPALRGLPGARVAAVVDADAERAAAVARGFPGARAVSDLAALDDQLLSGATAVIATPGHSHAALAETLLARGASLLIEKPVALDAAGFAAVSAAAEAADRPVSVFKNYRLRPNALALWRFLVEHEVGAPVAARIEFHAPRLVGERARWMLEERRFRVLPLEQAIHFVDIACVVCGPLETLDHVSVARRADGAATVAIRAFGRTAGGATLDFDLDLAGTANRTCVTIAFERCTVELAFYPEGFRVLPRTATPLDDLAAAATRFGAFAWQKLRPNRQGVPKRALPHLYVYRRHLAAAGGIAMDDPFSLAGVGDTMRSLYMLCERAY